MVDVSPTPRVVAWAALASMRGAAIDLAYVLGLPLAVLAPAVVGVTVGVSACVARRLLGWRLGLRDRDVAFRPFEGSSLRVWHLLP